MLAAAAVLVIGLSAPRPTVLPKRAPTAHPGTTALTSPPGFEEAYSALRALREETGRPLLDVSQLETYAPRFAAQLRESVDFDVPRTVPQALRCFFQHPTILFICAAFTLTTAARCTLGALSPMDGVVAIATAAGWCFQEHFIHDKLLHSTEDWFGRDIHRWHHELPYYHVSFDGIGEPARARGAAASSHAAPPRYPHSG